jgi:hypothetical protein
VGMFQFRGALRQLQEELHAGAELADFLRRIP